LSLGSKAPGDHVNAFTYREKKKKNSFSTLINYFDRFFSKNLKILENYKK